MWVVRNSDGSAVNIDTGITGAVVSAESGTVWHGEVGTNIVTADYSNESDALAAFKRVLHAASAEDY